MTRQWYALRIKPNSEGLAAKSLSRDGYNILLPRVKTHLRSGAFREVAFFPGYLFIRFDMQDESTEMVRSHPGVLGWVHFDSSVPPVPDKVMADLKDRLDMLNGSGGMWTRFRPEDIVRVVYGAMDSLGKVLEDKGSPHGRVNVLLEFMGSWVTAQVPRHSLQHAGNADWNARRKLPRRTRGRGRWINGFDRKAVANSLV